MTYFFLKESCPAEKIIILLVGLLLEFICKIVRLCNGGHLNMTKLIFQLFNTLVGGRGVIATFPI